jgi:prepilin-type N-terminal cleavage/methylation domain-containing protein
MKKKGFTLVELLVVIAVIALLMGLLMPALARVRQIAHRMICGSNLSSIGKGCLLYAQDHDEEFPKGGLMIGNAVTWTTDGQISNPYGLTRYDAFGAYETATVTSALCLLVKYTETTPKTFNCRGDEGVKEFTLDEVIGLESQPHIKDVTDIWDFGDKSESKLPPGQYNSYAYHLPYDEGDGLRGWPITPISSPESPIAADRNPFLDKNAVAGFRDPALSEYDAKWYQGAYSDEKKKENTVTHQREGQNVLYQDGHVDHARFPNCGIRKDNIWKSWTGVEHGSQPTEERERQVGSGGGEPTDDGDYGPVAEEDAYLVSEKNAGPGEDWGRP